MTTFVDKGVSRGQRGRTSTTVYLSFLDRSRYFFLISSSFMLTRLSGPVPDPLLLRKSGSAGNGTRDLCICSQELWTRDHRSFQARTYLFIIFGYLLDLVMSACCKFFLLWCLCPERSWGNLKKWVMCFKANGKIRISFSSVGDAIVCFASTKNTSKE
jgi:hypothetical protein